MGGVIRRESVSAAPTFSFCDVEREARAITDRARTEAERLIAEARQRAADAEARARQQLETRQREGYERGLADGRRAGLEQVKREARQAALQAANADVARLTQALTAGLAEYDRDRRGLIALAESGLIELSVAIARRVCKTLIECSADAARENARALLELVKHHNDLELHVHPEEYELLRDVANGFTRQVAEAEHVTIVPDQTVTRGGCVLRTRDGTIDTSISSQIDRIAEAICAYNVGHAAAVVTHVAPADGKSLPPDRSGVPA